MDVDRRFQLTAVIGVALIVAAAISDFLVGSFWQRHTLLTSLLANLVVVAVTVIVINELVERRDRERWSLLAQHVLFSLVQSARATWTGLLEVLEVGEVSSGAEESLRAAARMTEDTERLSTATRRLLADEQRRARLQRLALSLSDHSSRVIADWAPVMVGARTYAAVLDRHVELAGRLEWLNSVLAHNEPPEGQSRREEALNRSNVATEKAEELGSDDWLHDQILALIVLATDLDYESREHAFSIVPVSSWAERTQGLAAAD
jgi:rRNA maturation endonuclease Nob1